MQHDQFIGLVQEKARLESRGAAERVSRATLQALSERLTGDAAKNLAAQLPQEIGEHLRGSAAREADRMSFDEFVERARELEKTPAVAFPDALHHVRAVMDVMTDAVSPDEMSKVRQQLPKDFYPMFGNSEGRLRSA